MKNVESYLQVMKKLWQQEPKVKNSFLVFYLTPEQRYERLKEIMAPLSQKQNIFSK
ncbi:hypothetical protein [Pseudocitrobacter corydidari]|uniref:Uncharacterized protein n=1 Tax=Pseudocitrobacter corydidari TaxID=2891570 RepID=A0ABY3S206_9ENTR|nr:hypothetical protein [Pseudocitrobacter corydidari]UGS40715.1 hypothetical protein G163CM_14140 [Pseudocitrobacter corydidari]